MIAVTMPGKIGDALYAIPYARLLYGIHGEKVDFYTSEYCRPIVSLVEHQPFINEVIIPRNYTIERMDMGCQPWLMPVKDGYHSVVHCGFRGVPDRSIHQYIAKSHNYYEPLAIRYEFPKLDRPCGSPYVCIAPRGITSYRELFNNTARLLLQKGIRIAIVGGKGDNSLDSDVGIMDFTGYDMLQTLSIMYYSNGFVGLMSAMLVLANGLDIVKVSPHDNKSWDMRHVVNTRYNYYPINPSARDVVALLT